MRFALAALLFFAILTLWVPAEWPVTIFETGVFLLALLSIARARPSFAWPLVPLLAAPLWGAFQLATHRTLDPFQTAASTVRFAAFLATFLAAAHVFRDRGALRWFRSAMLWFAFVVSILATVQTFTSHGDVFWLFPTGVTDYVMGPILYRNHYAVFIETVLPIALYCALRRRDRATLYLLMAAAMYASVIACASRTGAVLATAEILAVALLMLAQGRTSWYAVRAALPPMLLLFAILTAVAGPQTVWRRLREPDPMVHRRELNLSSRQMMAEHPWTGIGLGAWPAVYPAYARFDIGLVANQAHNDWYQWAAEGGIPFAILMFTLLLWAIPRGFDSIWGIGAIAVLVHAAVDYPFSRPGLGAWPIVILAMISASRPKWEHAASEEAGCPPQPAPEKIS